MVRKVYTSQLGYKYRYTSGAKLVYLPSSQEEDNAE